MQNNKKSIMFVVNPISGTKSKEGITDVIHQTIDGTIYDWEVAKTTHAGHAVEIARQCAARGVDICVAVGGDGTVNEVARGLTDSQTALGIIPRGSGNGLARHLCIPMDVRRAMEIINVGQTDAFDYGVINGRPFFCTCGMGFDAIVSKKFSESGRRGLATYVENVVKTAVNFQPDTYIVEDETGTHHHKAFLVACANAAQYGNNAYIAPGASMQDGLLDVIIMEPFNVVKAPTVAIDLFAKTLDHNQCIKTFQTRKLHIHREKSGAVHFDGDPIEMGNDIDIEIKPGGLRAVINPSSIEDKAQPNKVADTLSNMIHKVI